MEKIYEENGYTPKKSKMNFSIVLSFVVAAFAIVSLIVVGFNQISYAAPTTETMTLKFGKWGTTDAFIKATNDQGTIEVRMLFADSENASTATSPVFCIEAGRDPSTAANAYSSEGEVYNDSGLVYILNHSNVLNSSQHIIPRTVKYPAIHATLGGTQLNDDDYKALETYATQVAVWLYLRETSPTSSASYGTLTNSEMTAMTTAANIYSTKDNYVNAIYSGNLYNSYIKNLVDSAKTATNAKTIRAVLASENITLVGDHDIYQTDKVSVVANPSSDLVNYSVDLSGLDGAYVVDKDGNTKTSLDTFAPTDYFYVRVPVNKVTDENNRLKIEIVGEFTNYLGGEYYIADGAQSLVTVTSGNFRVTNEAYINFMTAPPTGMTTAQTIYFIGLIVLLCGVGIIYANAKPVEEK